MGFRANYSLRSLFTGDGIVLDYFWDYIGVFLYVFITLTILTVIIVVITGPGSSGVSRQQRGPGEM